MNGNGRAVEIKVERVNAERTNVRFKVYAGGKIWLGVSFVKDGDGRVHSLFKCREFYNEEGVLVKTGNTVIIPQKTFWALQTKAKAILR